MTRIEHRPCQMALTPMLCHLDDLFDLPRETGGTYLAVKYFSFPGHFTKNLFQSLYEEWKVQCDYAPEDIKVHMIISVD